MTTLIEPWRALAEEFEALGGTLPSELRTPSGEWNDPGEGAGRASAVSDRYRALFTSMHTGQPRSALCLSGGGIRSATFNLGVMQELAELGVLGRFDYLSTVSGGGYIGAWLTGWRYRDGGDLKPVLSELCEPPSPDRPEPEQLRHMRRHSSYLSPHVGVLSIDTWTLVATYLRNLMLNWIVLIPLLLAVLAIPRVYVAAVGSIEQLIGKDETLFWIRITAPGALLPLAWAFGYAGRYQPGAFAANKPDVKPGLFGLRPGRSAHFLLWCFVPLLIAALWISALWRGSSSLGAYRNYLCLAAGLFAAFFGWLLFAIFARTEPGWAYLARANRGKDALRLLCAALISGLMTGAAMWGGAELMDLIAARFQETYLGVAVRAIFSCLGVPLTLLAFAAGGGLYVGLVSRVATMRDDDREWWARFGAWVLLAAAVWLIVGCVVLLGPLAVLTRSWLDPILAGVGGVSGFVVAILGWSRRTPALPDAASGARKSRLPQLALLLAAPLCALVLFVYLSVATTGILSAWVDTEATGIRWHLYVLQETPIWLAAAFAGGLGALGWVASFAININRFSMHGMYRDRLVRAYLGASNLERKPHPFTGFDPQDNVYMYKLLPEVLRTGDACASPSVLDLLRAALESSAAPAPAVSLTGRIPDQLRRALQSNSGADAAKWLTQRVLDWLNDLIIHSNLEKECALRPDPAAARKLGGALRRSVANRLAIEAALPGAFVALTPERLETIRPIHVVNIALNLVGENDTAWQERKAESFTVTPLHSGSGRLGYRTSKSYGGPRGITLGTSITMSGAAVSPNMGYHSSPIVAFLLTLFNIRLGWWLGNPGPYGENTFNLDGPRVGIMTLISEALSRTDARHGYVYLSDGGHFENLGLYEMVRRRCRTIVLCDAGCDPKCGFTDLGNAARKIRVDLGVQIVFDRDLRVTTRDVNDPAARCCVVGRIIYRDVDKLPGSPEGESEEVEDGVLVYIKPALGVGEPADVVQYARACRDFPHETTADQFFSESQFESYRALGAALVKHIYSHPPAGHTRTSKVDPLQDLVERARAYVHS